MTDYTKLVKALRCCSKDKCGQCEYEWNRNREFCMNSMCADAADAIEALQAEVDKYHELCDVGEIPEVLEILMTV